MRRAGQETSGTFRAAAPVFNGRMRDPSQDDPAKASLCDAQAQYLEDLGLCGYGVKPHQKRWWER